MVKTNLSMKSTEHKKKSLFQRLKEKIIKNISKQVTIDKEQVL
jgi:hypothetical protein